MSLRKKYIGDREFYRKLFSVMLPVLLQNVITNFVSLLDNIMIGVVGTEPMSGVAIVNQMNFVFNLAIFGGLSGAGIFTAQYYGKGDEEGVRSTMRAKAWIVLAITGIAVTLFLAFGTELMSLFIHEGEDDIDLAATLMYGQKYLRIIIFQLPLFALLNVYASTLRETGNTDLPMRAGITAVLVNLTFNYILIYGKLGAPALGVEGAAMATVLARIVEVAIVICGSRFHGVWKTMHVPAALAKDIARKGAPLLCNELLWSVGMTTTIQILSLKGVEVVSAENICNTISNLFFCAFFATGTTITIIIGQLLGAGEFERAIEEDRKLIAFSVFFSTAVGLVMIVLAPLIPRIYNTTDMVRHLASRFILINAVMMPSNSFIHSCYFTMRSGGKVIITLLYDSVYLWILVIPVTWILVHYSAMPVVWIYAISYFIDIFKDIAGYFLVHSHNWVRNIVDDK